MFNIPAGRDPSQDFGGLGEWYLHVYVPSTGEWSATGPYKGELGKPNDPTVNVSQTGWTNEDVIISMTENGDTGSTAYDKDNNIYTSYTSGVYRGEWRYQGESWQGYGRAITETKEGFKIIEGKIIDWVTNESNVVSKSFGIDKTPPIIGALPSGDWTNKDVNINITSNDRLSGMNNIKLVDSKDSIVAMGIDTINYIETIEGTHNYRAIATDNAGNTYEENFTINIDRTAPSGDVKYNFNEEDVSVNVKVENVIEVGSGVKDVWVEYSPKEDPSIVIKEGLIRNPDGSYEITTDLFDKLGSSNTVNITVKAEDNVGNIGDLGSHEIDMFKITARIERVLAPHDPIFKAGEKGILKIKLYGGVDKYKITFPKELVALDSNLNTEVNITPQKVTEINYEFFIPLEARSGNFYVTVEGFKNGEKKISKPTFVVTGSITDNLRTRIRLPERN